MVTITKDKFPQLKEGLLKYQEALEDKRKALRVAQQERKFSYQKQLAEEYNKFWLRKLLKQTIPESEIFKISLYGTKYEVEYEAFAGWTHDKLDRIWEQQVLVTQLLISIQEPVADSITLRPEFFSSLITYIVISVEEHVNER